MDMIGALEGINGSIQLVKAISGASGAIEKAELKFKAAELISTLADVKITLVEAREEACELRLEIAKLQKALELKATVVRANDAYYEMDADGRPNGDPFCARCWQVDHRLVNLPGPQRANVDTTCPQCKAKFPRHRTLSMHAGETQ